MDNYILLYYQAIQTGEEDVGTWVRMIYEYIIHGLATGQFRYDGKKANRAIRFIETSAIIAKGGTIY